MPVAVVFLCFGINVNVIALVLLFSGHRMVRLSVDDLVADAVEAFKINECIEEPPEEQAIQVRHLLLFFSSALLYRLSNQR